MINYLTHVSGSTNNKHTPSPRKILLLSNDEITLSLHQRFLKQLGYLVDIVDAGEQAIERLANENYDGMLLELELPGVTGEVILTSIRLQASIESQFPGPLNLCKLQLN